MGQVHSYAVLRPRESFGEILLVGGRNRQTPPSPPVTAAPMTTSPVESRALSHQPAVRIPTVLRPVRRSSVYFASLDSEAPRCSFSQRRSILLSFSFLAASRSDSVSAASSATSLNVRRRVALCRCR